MSKYFMADDLEEDISPERLEAARKWFDKSFIGIKSVEVFCTKVHAESLLEILHGNNRQPS